MYKRILLLAGVAVLAVLLWSLVGRGTSTNYSDSQDMLLFRRIGHELLLASGDTKSRVLPVKKVAADEWRIEFENPFAFSHDSLVGIVARVLNPMQSPTNYIINVADKKNDEIVYSFAKTATGSQATCSGRSEPKGQYALNILFSTTAAGEPGFTPGKTAFWAAGFLAICLGIFAWRFTRNRTEKVVSPPAEPISGNYIAIGKFQFYPLRHTLIIGNNSIELTAKEAKLLRIFSDAPNEVIDRNQLLKEGWEDEGVITGRSLDMYVSKLRKKLQADDSVSIINVHGKGYRLNC